MYDIYTLIINFIFGTLAWIFLLRLLVQLVRAPFNNSLVQPLYRFLAPILKPFERFIPRYGNFSIPCFVVILLIGQLWSMALTLSVGAPAIVLGLYLAIEALYWQLTLVLIAFAISSFFPPNPYNDVLALVNIVARPIVAPIKRVIPPFGPLDLSVPLALLALTIAMKLCTLGLAQLLPKLVSAPL
jgi:YggT family protein